jgi:hypothetical protein
MQNTPVSTGCGKLTTFLQIAIALAKRKLACRTLLCSVEIHMSIVAKQKVLFTVNITRNRMQNPIIKIIFFCSKFDCLGALDCQKRVFRLLLLQIAGPPKCCSQVKSALRGKSSLKGPLEANTGLKRGLLFCECMKIENGTRTLKTRQAR